MLGKAADHTTEDEFVQLLLDCHGRIRNFAAGARRLATAETDEVSADEVRDTAWRIRRYFGEALPLHVADEEESLYPRLHGRDTEVDAALERMEREHADHRPHLATLLELCGMLAEAPERHATLRTQLGETAGVLEREFGRHLEHEEALILPAIPRLLTLEEQAAMTRELRERRARQW